MRMVKQSAGVLLDERQTVRGQRTPTINAGGASWGGGALALLEIGREHGLEHLGACAKDPFAGIATSGSMHSVPGGPTRKRTSGTSPMAFRRGLRLLKNQCFGVGQYYGGFHSLSMCTAHLHAT